MPPITNKLKLLCTTLAVPISFCILFLPSCSNHLCSCEQQCQYFNHDTVVICSVNFGSDSSFQAAIDSANKQYGAATKDSLINYQNFKSNAAKVSQLENEGYHCSCITNGW
jgi:hypothetical protein